MAETATLDRVTAGVPQGGQFTARSHPEADIRLDLSDEEYNQTGTFLYPPKARSAAQHLAFWENCPVADAVLDNICLGYEEWRAGWRGLKMNELLAQYDHKNKVDPIKLRFGTLPAHVAAPRNAAIAKLDNELDNERPRSINALNAKAIARAGQMWWYASDLNEAERAVVYAHRVELRNSIQTVEELAYKYQVMNLRDSFEDPQRTMLRRLKQLTEETVKNGQLTAEQTTVIAG